MFTLANKKIFIAGETGLVGRAMIRALQAQNVQILSAPHAALDLMHQTQTYDWLKTYQPDIIIMAAGKVGGIGANASDQAGFLHENLAMAQNVVHGAYQAGVSRLLYLGSSCIYPKNAPQPLMEEALLTGVLEPTNEGYALAKIAGLKLCEYYNQQYGLDYISVMPTNLYGPYDHFDLHKSHVIPALILKIYQAKINSNPVVTLWGTGKPLREFLYVDDLAQALVHVLKHYNAPLTINIGSGIEVTIHDLALMLKQIIDYTGVIEFDSSKPDGTMRKVLDCSKINALGWNAKTPLGEGLSQTYQWFLDNQA